jgi:hypothetical protein
MPTPFIPENCAPRQALLQARARRRPPGQPHPPGSSQTKAGVLRLPETAARGQLLGHPRSLPCSMRSLDKRRSPAAFESKPFTLSNKLINGRLIDAEPADSSSREHPP